MRSVVLQTKPVEHYLLLDISGILPTEKFAHLFSPTTRPRPLELDHALPLPIRVHAADPRLLLEEFSIHARQTLFPEATLRPPHSAVRQSGDFLREEAEDEPEDEAADDDEFR